MNIGELVYIKGHGDKVFMIHGVGGRHSLCVKSLTPNNVVYFFVLRTDIRIVSTITERLKLYKENKLRNSLNSNCQFKGRLSS